ncbi:hypothetical protein P346_01659 [Enterobacter sp. DC1]|uniref:hypothetical protein n=1 Tax=Enterobacter sp. DC1 TaxID=314330 RepID=UPI0003ED0753|nr:hypothetical protein [Enterobacter sp. DC1]EWG70477.1 hypothetical protein P346_01659 [Enterobacter sp. DC1]
MITEKNNVFYCDCGFSFLRGHSGAHDCAVGLRNKLARSESRCAALAAENAGLKANLMFCDAEDPEAPYDNPGEIAEACSLNYNEEFVVQVAAKMPNRTYRVCESWEHECKVELVDGSEVETPDTDAFLAEVRAQGVEMAAKSDQFSTWVQQGLRSFAIGVRQGVQ